MYVADWRHYKHVYATASTAIYTKAEEVRAKIAYDLLRTSGYPSIGEAVHLIQDGNITGMPTITVDDLRRAYDIYGTPPEYVRGKMTKRKVSRAIVDQHIIMEEKRQVLSADVMHIDGKIFLLTTCEPLQLTLQCPINNESQNQLGLALQGHLDFLRSRNFIPTIVYTDPAKAFRGLVTFFPGVTIDVGGAGDHLAKVDAKIRRVKELYRSVKHSLPWKLPSIMVKDLVAYAVSRINIRRTTAINQNVCPKVLFTGMKVNYKRELSLAFGDYCEVYDGTNNTSDSRSIPCIALFPTNNSTGSWEFMSLKTKTRVRRSQWKLMATNELIIDIMNCFEEKNLPMETSTEPTQEPMAPTEAEEQSLEVVEPAILQEELTDEAVPDLVDDVENSDDEGDDEESVVEESEPGIATRTRSQTGTEINPPKRFTMAVKVNKSQETGERKAAIAKAEKDEIELLFVDLGGLKPEYAENMKGKKAYNCHMFGVEKFLATGEHDKFKARLVFNGNEQDADLFPDRSSPTAALHSIMACLAVAASNGITKVGKIDVKGAFIQTEMEGPPVYVRCDKNLTKLIVEVLPGIRKYVTKDGTLYCRLLKALYGCVQASKLWYNKLTKFLRSLGYEHSPTDPCVMRKLVDGSIYLLVIYVDDILVLASEEEMARLKDAFIAEFQWITMEISDSHSYLGMHIMMRNGYAVIDMTNFIEKLLQEHGQDVAEFDTPADKNIFSVDDGAKLLDESSRKEFHTTVAKLLYLTKRARPEIATATGFLCTRVTKASEQDRIKLRRVLGFLKRTRGWTLHLKIGDVLRILAYVDAAFAPHPDAKSHTGIAVFLGEALVFAASRKQKCVTKSPTDSELVALTDNIGFVELFNEFIGFITNTTMPIPIIYQDSTSVISLVKEGGGVARTKHLRVRMELCKEALKENRIEVLYMPTGKMIADCLTKALDGKAFLQFVAALLGMIVGKKWRD